MLEVRISDRAKKYLKRVPDFIVDRFNAWVVSLRVEGLEATRKRPGLHDELLKGERKGQRSVRLNRAYRAIYIAGQSGELILLEVLEVNKHKY